MSNGLRTPVRVMSVDEMADRIEELEAKLAQQDDLVQAAVAAALVRAADTVEDWGRLLSGTEDVSEEVIGDILALITPEEQAALDRVVAAERERWAQMADDWFYDPENDVVTDTRLGAAIRKGGE